MATPEPDAPIAQVETPDGIFRGFADDVITKHLVDFGAHTRNELAMVLDHVDASEVFVDLGAHIGTYSIPIARRLGGTGRILAVEGSEAVFALLRSNVLANGLESRIETRCAIVGDGAGRRMRRVEVEGHSGASHYVFDETALLVGQDAYTLLCSAGFAEPTFVKIDVEGMELFVLRSLEPTISAHRPKLYIEMNKPTFSRFGVTYRDVQDYLRSFGYGFFRNFGQRNSGSDLYDKRRLDDLEEGGQFYDLLALPE